MKNIERKLVSGILMGSMLLKSIFPSDYFSIGKNESCFYDYNTSIVNEDSPKFLDNKYSQLFVNSDKNNYNFNNFVKQSSSKNIENVLKNNFIDVRLGISNSGDKCKFLYYNNGLGKLSNTEKKKVGYVNSFFEEDKNKTYLYLVLPHGVNLEDNSQSVYALDCKNGKISSHELMPGDKTIAYKLICNVNDLLEFYLDDDIEELKESEEYSNFGNVLSLFQGMSISSIIKNMQTEFENRNFEYSDNAGEYIQALRKIPGVFGGMVDAAVTLGGILEEINQKKIVKGIEKKFNEDYTINRIKMYTTEDKDMFGKMWIGRRFDLDFKKDFDYNGENGFLVIPSILFTNRNNSSKCSMLEDIIFDIDFN
jgi:hypothetical protein